MSAIYAEDEDDVSIEEILLGAEDTGELTLDDIAEEEENDPHKVLTYNTMDDGESYFDGAYFDE